MKGPMPLTEHVAVISSDESSSSDEDMEVSDAFGGQQSSTNIPIDQPAKVNTSEGELIRSAERYQDFMKQLPIPTYRGSLIPFTSWVDLGTSIKQLYEQPLHYLTNILLKKWDESSFNSENESLPLDTIIHPCKAEVTIWLIEEVHRHTTSYHHIAKLWESDKMRHAYIDSVIPKMLES